MTPLRPILTGLLILTLVLLAAPLAVEAQQARLYRVGVILHGGAYSRAVDGLRDGLKESGFEEGKQFVFHVRETKGDLKSVEAAARNLEQEKVDLIFAVTTSVALAANGATKIVPIVFYAGADPVAAGLVASFSKPGGRLTGIYGRFSDLSPKQLQLLKEMIPAIRRVVTFYSPDNPAARATIKIVRDATRQLKVELLERPVASVEELRAGLRALRAGEADALVTTDAMVISQAELVIEAANAIKLPTMFSNSDSVAKGALAGYGVSYYVFGRQLARNVQRILLGADPGSIPVEQLDRPQFVINLKTAKALGLTISQSMLARADEIIR